MNQNTYNHIEEDEIDLKELFLKIWEKKLFIVSFTLLVTILAAIFAFTKTPIYEVKSNVEIGYIGDELLNNLESINQQLRVVYNVDEPALNDKLSNAWVSDISVNKKVKNYLLIKTNGLSNEDALEKNKEVLEYIQKSNQSKIDNFIRNTKLSIENMKKDLEYVDMLEIPDIKRNIEKLKTQKLVQIDEQLNRLKTQDIKNIQREIGLIKTQKITAIEDKIKVLNNKLAVIQNKINFNKEKLKEYNNSINKLYKESQGSNSTGAMIFSIQMVNYQNLILNTQNKNEDLSLEQNIIRTESIPNLNNEKENLKNVTIDNLNKKIENIKNINIVNLENEKENLNNNIIKKLEEKINITLRDKKISLDNKIKNLEYQISSSNIQNSTIVGEYIVYDHPIQPKKKLIVVVAFVSGFILSIFLVFFIEFIKGIKRED